MDVTLAKARQHAVALRQCALFASDAGEHIAKAMTDAADFLDGLAKIDAGTPPNLVLDSLTRRIDD